MPTYNESANLPRLLERLEAALSRCDEPFEVIVVDDDSPDGTSALALSLQSRYPWLRVVTRHHQRDLSTAVVAGWLEAGGDVLGVIDGDLQHPPELLPQLLGRLRGGANDIVIASRHVRGGGVSQWSLFRRLISWGATLMAGAILPGTLSRVRDPMSGYFLLRRQVVEGAPLRPVGYKILLEVLAKADYGKIEEVPYVFEERFQGGSKLAPRHGWQYLLHLASIALDTGELRRVAGYALVGVVGATVNFAALAAFLRAGAGLTFALPASIAFAVANNFVWNDLLTFPETRRRIPGLRAALGRFTRFAWVSLTGALLNLAIAALLIRVAHLRTAIAVAIGVFAAGAWNFLVNSRVTWKVWWDRSAHLGHDSRAAVPPPPPGLTCNLCGGRRFTLLYRGRVAGPALRPDLYCCTSLDHGDYTNVLRCTACSLVVQAPAAPVEQIEQCYRDVEDPVYLREEQGRIRTFDNLLAEIEDVRREAGMLNGGRRLLDVGCYTGVFLDRARRGGWDVQGVEPSRWAAARARERGLAVLDGLLAENDPDRPRSPLKARSFDAVTVWDVIEHFADPIAEVRRVASLLKPGGLLAISTMDVESGFARLLGARWPWLMRMHLYYFSSETLRMMLERCGLRVLAVRRHRRIVSARYLLEKASAQRSSLAPLFRVAARMPLLGRFYVPVNFGDIINVYAVRQP